MASFKFLVLALATINMCQNIFKLAFCINLLYQVPILVGYFSVFDSCDSCQTAVENIVNF